jgi:hypothetical protein
MRWARIVICVSLLSVLTPIGRGSAQTVLMVTTDTSLNTEETARRNQLQSWGYTVTTVADNATQTVIDAAVATANVVYVPCTIDDWELLYKLRTTTKGVVTETPGLDTEFGYASADGYTQSWSTLDNVNNTHEVTSGVASGTLTITNSNQNLALNGNTLAAGLQVLATMNFGSMSLGVIEAGGTLANTNGGNSTASGRRVRLPWGYSFAFSSLNANGLSLLQKSLAWALGRKVLLHYKLDQTTGTSVTDSSVSGYTGTVTGTAVWTSAVRNNGFDFNGNTKIQTNSLLGMPANISMAAWVDLDVVDTAGSDVISLGDHIVLRLLPALVQVSMYNGTTWVTTSSNFTTVGSGWHHYAFTFDDAANQLKIYIDGQLATTVTENTSINYTGLGTATVIGRNGNTATTMDVDGRVDDVRVYNYALTPAEIAVIYGLVGHFRLDESSGTAVADASGAGNTGTLTGTATWTAAVRGRGQRFNYTNGDDYITIANSTSVQDIQEDDYAIAFWFKPESVPPGTGYANDGVYGLVIKNGLTAGVGYTHDQKFAMSHPFSDSSVLVAESASTFAPGSFYHVAVVVKRAAGTLTLYVNGRAEATQTFTANRTAYEQGTNTWKLGIANPGAGSYKFAADGTLDDVRLYNRALTSLEIEKLYGTSGYWKFDETSGTIATDSSGAKLDGTYLGSPSLNQEGIYATAPIFNGAASVDYVSLPNTAVTGKTTVSVSFWIKSTYTGEQAVLSGNNASQDNEFLLHFGSHTEFRVYCHGSTQSWTVPSIADGQWHHFVVASTSAGNTTTVYRDGVSVGAKSVSANGTAFNIAVGGLIVAQEQDSVGGSFANTQCVRGQVDDLRIFERALSSKEVAQLFGLLGRWQFSEGAGTVVTESTGLASNANVTGATWTSDCSGNMALSFDGVDDSAATTASFDPPNEGTVAFWFRSAGPGLARQRLWGLNSDFEMWQDPDGKISCDVSTDGYQGGCITTTPLNTAGRWYYIAAQYNADTEAYTIFVDGEFHKSGVSSWAITDQAPGTLSFGTRTGATDYFNGAIRDFRIYNRKMTPTEIANHSGLIAHWQLDETSGAIANDLAVANNDGTYVGSPTLGVQGSNASANGTAVNFNGTSQYVTSGAKLLNGLSKFTLAAWIRPDRVTPSISFLGQNGLIEFGIDTSANKIDLWTNSGGALVANHQLALAKWSHVAAVGTGAGLKIYVNGIEVGYGGSATTSYGTNSGIFKVGEGVLNPSGNYFAGRIDDVRVYRRALCPTEIESLYQGGRPMGVRIIRWVETR